MKIVKSIGIIAIMCVGFIIGATYQQIQDSKL